MLFYEIKVNYQRQTGENNPGKVKETYLVEGLTCSDVEKRLMDEIQPLVFGDLEVPSCKKVQLYDLVTSPEAEHWYKARVEMITIDDHEKETRKAVNILVEANDIEQAVKTLRQHLSSLDYEIASITRSQILEVLRAV